MPSSARPEQRSFRIFWKWLTGEILTDEQLNAKQNPCDPPDFLFSHDGRSVAMEHTEVFRRVSRDSCVKPQIFEPMHDRAIQARIQDHMEKHLKQAPDQIPPVHISVTFSSCKGVSKSDEASISKDILDLVRSRCTSGISLPLELYINDLSGHPSLLGECACRAKRIFVNGVQACIWSGG
jgi:hypothetical protein